MGMTIGLLVQGPAKKINKPDIKKAKEYGKHISEVIDTSVIGMSVKDTLGKNAALIKKRIIKLAAILFDRICSRTPMDEDYKGTLIKEITDKGTGERTLKEISVEHHADKNFCRLDWKIQIGPRTITAYELWRSNNSLFEEYNKSKDIDYIADYFEHNFKKVDLKFFDVLQVENMNDHFAKLEFGEYKQSESQIFSGHKYKHGLKNHHSVQAPNGMMRLTLAELDRISQESRVKSLSRRYRSQRTSKVLNDTQLKSLSDAVKKGKGYFTLSDMERILGADAGDSND